MSVDLNQTIAEASLDNMHDIIVPNAVSFFPLAPGRYGIIALCLALIFHFIIQIYKNYQAKQYKREALLELDSYKEKTKENSIALLSLSKRIALVAYGRKEVARLADEPWWNFMEKHSTLKFTNEFRMQMSQLLYDDTYVLNDVQYESLKQVTETWIRTHKAKKDV